MAKTSWTRFTKKRLTGGVSRSARRKNEAARRNPPQLQRLEDRIAPATVLQAGNYGNPNSLGALGSYPDSVNTLVTPVGTTFNVSYGSPQEGGVQEATDGDIQLADANPPVSDGNGVLNNSIISFDPSVPAGDTAIPFLVSVPYGSGSPTFMANTTIALVGGELNQFLAPPPNVQPYADTQAEPSAQTVPLPVTGTRAPLTGLPTELQATVDAIDPDGELLTINGEFSYTPPPGYAGTVSFQYEIGIFQYNPVAAGNPTGSWTLVDGLLSNEATVTINVEPTQETQSLAWQQAAGPVLPSSTLLHSVPYQTDLAGNAEGWNGDGTAYTTFAHDAQRTSLSVAAPITDPAQVWLNNDPSDMPSNGQSPVIGAPVTSGLDPTVVISGQSGIRGYDNATGAQVYDADNGSFDGTPAIDGLGNIYTAYSDSDFYSFDKNADENWEVELPASEQITTSPALAGAPAGIGTRTVGPPQDVYFAATNTTNPSQGMVYGVTTTNGAFAFETAITGIPVGAIVFAYDPTDTADPWAIYVRSDGNDGFITKLNATTGQVLWQIETSITAEDLVGSPVVEPDGSSLYYVTQTGLAVAIDAATTAQEWNYQLPVGSGGGGSPALDYFNRVLYVPFSDGVDAFSVGPSALNPTVPVPAADNAPLLTLTASTLHASEATPAIVGVGPGTDDPMIYVSSMDNNLYAFYGVGSSLAGTQAWEINAGTQLNYGYWKQSPAVDALGDIVIGHTNGGVELIDQDSPPIFEDPYVYVNPPDGGTGPSYTESFAGQLDLPPSLLAAGVTAQNPNIANALPVLFDNELNSLVPVSDSPGMGALPPANGNDTGSYNLGIYFDQPGLQMSFTAAGVGAEPGDSVSFSLVGAPAGASMDSSGDFTWTPAANQTGEFTFGVQLTSTWAGRASSLDLTTVAPITVWVVPSAVTATVLHGQTVSLNLVGAVDPDPTYTPTVTILTNPTEGSLVPDPSPGVYDYTANLNYVGADVFTFQVTDGSTIFTGFAYINVIDQPPVVVDDSVSVLHGQTVAINLASLASDPYGTPLTFSVVTPPSYGYLSYNDGTDVWEYTANDNYVGPDAFTFVANDGALNSNIGTISIDVTDEPPVVENASVSVLHGQTVAINLAALTSDPDGLPYTVSIVTPPNDGSVSYNESAGVWEYTANVNYVGSDAFTFVANDGALNSNTGTISINVTDQPPVVENASVSVPHGETVAVNLAALVSDPDGLPYALLIVTPPSHGSISYNGGTGMYEYTANVNYVGSDAFTFVANDGALNSNTGTISITVSVQAPTAENQAAQTVEGAPVVISVLAGDSDPIGAPLQVVGVTQGADGSVHINPNNTVIYTPISGFIGVDQFLYTISDGPMTATATVTVTVGQPQLAAGGAKLDATDVPLLTEGELQAIIPQAEQVVEQEFGLPDNSSLFSQVDFQIANLQDGILGITYGNTIWIDQSAAGYGWYVGGLAGDTSVFTTSGAGQDRLASASSAAYGKMDLLTVVSHELGHIAGYASVDAALLPDNLMTTTLEPGVRRVEATALAPSVSNPVAAAGPATGDQYQANDLALTSLLAPGESPAVVGDPSRPGRVTEDTVPVSVADALFMEGAPWSLHDPSLPVATVEASPSPWEPGVSGMGEQILEDDSRALALALDEKLMGGNSKAVPGGEGLDMSIDGYDSSAEGD
jgi:hypothetical protein